MSDETSAWMPGPWLLKLCYSGSPGKHSSVPLKVDDVVILNLSLPPETDPEKSVEHDSRVATAFITEDELPAKGLDVDLEAFRLISTDTGWAISPTTKSEYD